MSECLECGKKQAFGIQGEFNFSKFECDKCYYENSSAYERGLV